MQDFHNVFRVAPDGQLLVELVAQLTQEGEPPAGEDLGGLPLRGGTTLVAAEDGMVRYAIARPLPGAHLSGGASRVAEERQETLRALIQREDDGDPSLPWSGEGYRGQRALQRRGFPWIHNRALGRRSRSSGMGGRGAVSPPAPPPPAVVVRMYHVGLGDAFLLFFPGRSGPRKVLIDCGVHFDGESEHPLKTVIDHILELVRDPDGVPRIQVVVATHRHQDHVSGFESPRWRDVEVQEVWMPWTEEVGDPVATSIRERQGLIAELLTDVLSARDDDPQATILARNCLRNPVAMKTLHDGFAGEPRRRFLPPTSALHTFRPRALSGVTVHVLGPSHLESVIRDLDPHGDESFLRQDLARLRAGESAIDSFRPFRPDWSLCAEDFEREPSWAHLVLAEEERERLEALEDTGDLAAALADAINNTSLFLQFRVGRARLLFPGDSQWGTWEVAMADPARRALLEQTTFLKVGHHGSHNATPRRFVESLLPDGFYAMVPTHGREPPLAAPGAQVGHPPPSPAGQPAGPLAGPRRPQRPPRRERPRVHRAAPLHRGPRSHLAPTLAVPYR